MNKYIDFDGSELTIVSYGLAYGLGKSYYLDKDLKILHRLDGPAVEHSGGDYCWFYLGIRHRIGGPTSLWRGKLYWFINGKLVNLYYICG